MKHFDAAYLSRRLGAEFDVRAFSVCPSTNALLMREARLGAREGTLFVAERQSEGRGRLGRSFFSPAESGVYFSLLLSPDTSADPTHLTALSALCVCEAAEALGAPACRIKWVNDVYSDEKKCCGILTQGIYTNETLSAAVVGIGANLFPPKEGFPEEFAARAGALFDADRPAIREDFVFEVVSRLFARRGRRAAEILDEYRQRSCVLGRRVEVLQNGVSFFAEALEIEADLRLVVRDEGGRLLRLNSEEVRLVL